MMTLYPCLDANLKITCLHVLKPALHTTLAQSDLYSASCEGILAHHYELQEATSATIFHGYTHI